MDVESGSYLILNTTGRIIWEQLEQPILVAVLIKNLMTRFSVDEKTCTAETLDFLNKIAGQKALSML